MRNCFAPSTLVLAALLAGSSGALAQTAQRSGAAKTPPDLSGVWEVKNSGGPQGFLLKEEPSMLPWAEEVFKRLRQGTRTLTERTLNEGDPILYPYCLPHGFPRIFTHPPPFEIVQTPSQVLMIFETNHLVRQIYLDGRKHPDGAPPTFMGHSIGRWDGDTLLVETVGLIGLNGFARIDALGHPHTDALRVEERIRRGDQNTLEIDFLFEDPKTYSKPWTARKVFELKPDWEIMEYLICEEDQKELYLRDMLGGKKGPEQR